MPGASNYPFAKASYDEASAIRARVGNTLDGIEGQSAFFKSNYLKSSGWSALIKERLFRDRDHAVTAACEIFRYEFAYCLSVYDGSNDMDQDVFKVPLSRHALPEVHKRFYGPSYAIFEEQQRFMIVSDSDYYWALAGTPSFVTLAMADSAAKIIPQFRAGVLPYSKSQYPVTRDLGIAMLSFADTCERSWDDL